jgi:hypothetical protein
MIEVILFIFLVILSAFLMEIASFIGLLLRKEVGGFYFILENFYSFYKFWLLNKETY